MMCFQDSLIAKGRIMVVAYKRKACATCTYWGGAREINSFSNGVTCNKSEDTGICGNPKSSFKKKDTKAEYGSCSKYEKWEALSKLKV